nr:MAG TPA: hypothetical protein [Caudoviricetes sp.]
MIYVSRTTHRVFNREDYVMSFSNKRYRTT